MPVVGLELTTMHEKANWVDTSIALTKWNDKSFKTLPGALYIARERKVNS